MTNFTTTINTTIPFGVEYTDAVDTVLTKSIGDEVWDLIKDLKVNLTVNTYFNETLEMIDVEIILKESDFGSVYLACQRVADMVEGDDPFAVTSDFIEAEYA